MAKYMCLMKFYDKDIYYLRVTKVLCVYCTQRIEIEDEEAAYDHLLVEKDRRRNKSYTICHLCRRTLYTIRRAEKCPLCRLLVLQLEAVYRKKMHSGGTYPVIKELIWEKL